VAGLFFAAWATGAIPGKAAWPLPAAGSVVVIWALSVGSGLLAGLYRGRYQRGSLEEVLSVGTAGIVMLMLCGFAQSMTMVCHTVILLSTSSRRYRGRIMGVRMLAIYSLPLGLLAAGLLIGWIGFRATASLYAVVGLIFTVLIAVKWRASLWQSRTLAEVV